MPNTYTQIHIHCVFAVKHRAALIDNSFKDDLYKYISSIIQERGNKMLAIGGTANHIHIFFGYRAIEGLPELMKSVKQNSSLWVNKNHKTRFKFEWQKGYGAFSYSKSLVSNVCNYIERQEEHHSKQTFRDEYVEFLEKFGVDYDERYLFDDVGTDI